MNRLSTNLRKLRNYESIVGVVPILVGLCLLVGGLRAVDYFASLHAERLENEALSGALDQVCAQLAVLEADVGELSSARDRLAILAGGAPAAAVDSLPGLEAEGDRLTILRTSLERNKQRTVALGTDFAKIEGELNRRQDERERTPSILPTDGWLTAGFGNREDPFTGRRSFHWGIDVAAGAGTDVVATGAGRVVFSGRNAGYGNQIKIDHGNGLLTSYSHNKRNLVKRGDEVERGQVIAQVGSTGRSTSSHVHYEVHSAGKKVNPWRYLLPNDAVVD